MTDEAVRRLRAEHRELLAALKAIDQAAGAPDEDAPGAASDLQGQGRSFLTFVVDPLAPHLAAAERWVSPGLASRLGVAYRHGAAGDALDRPILQLDRQTT